MKASLQQLLFGCLVVVLATQALAATAPLTSDAFGGGFRDGWRDGSFERDAGYAFQPSTQRFLTTDTTTTIVDGKAYYVTVTSSPDATSYHVGYAFGYYQGFKQRQHPQYLTQTPYTKRTDPFYDGKEFSPRTFLPAATRYGAQPGYGAPYPLRWPGYAWPTYGPYAPVYQPIHVYRSSWYW